MENNSLRVLIIDDEKERAELLAHALQQRGYRIAGFCTTTEHIVDCLRQKEADVILVDVESPSRDMLEDMRWLSIHNPKPIALFTQDARQGQIAEAIRAGVSAYIVDGLQVERVSAVLEVAVVRFVEYQKLRTEMDLLKTRLEERKEIEKAKGMLMKFKGIDENQAYKELRKMAMDRQQRLVEVARYVQAILQQLDNDV